MSSIITESAILHQAALTTLDNRTTYRGEVLFPCIPAALGHYVQQIQQLLATVGKTFTPEEMEQVQKIIAQTLNHGYEATASAMLLLKYEISGKGMGEKELACSVAIAKPALSDQYQQWYRRDTFPLFGSHPDARVMSLLAQLGEPGATHILDIGAGTGRNTLPIARLGYRVDAIELTPEFATQLRTAAVTEKLPITVTEADLFDPNLQLKPDYYQLIVLSEVVSHFRNLAQLREMLVKASQALTPGGLLLFNGFFAIEGYEPDDLVRETAQVTWSSLFTRTELADALMDLPLVLRSDESVVEYEATHLPESAWPPTPWFIDWATGKSALPLSQEQPPIELRWLLFQKS